MSYRTAEKSYTNNWGENVYSHGSVDGDTWTWTDQSEMNGKTVRGRFILKRASEDSLTSSFDMGMGSDPLAKSCKANKPARNDSRILVHLLR
jgi:hypothetical protein